MSHDVQLPDPAAELLATSDRVAGPWLRRSAVGVLLRTAAPGANDAAEVAVEQAVERIADALHERLAELLALDVDQQRSNPLTLFREAVDELTAWLAAHGAQPITRDAFARDAHPLDVYGLYPARWDDVDPALQEPGIAWSAWKAMTVLRRRSDDPTSSL